MSDIFGIRDRISAAHALAADDKAQGIIYAALELRFCMEAVAYRQLSAYGEEIRSQLMKEWNPSKIIKTLTLFDEDSDQTAQISIAINPPPDLQSLMAAGGDDRLKGLDYLSVGTACRIPWKKFGKAYSTLGSFLHLGKSGSNLYPKRETLDDIFAMLEEVAGSTVVAAVNDVRVAECMCGALLVLGKSHLTGKVPINCGNRRCNAVYFANPAVPNSISPISQILVTCPCGAQVPFAAERMLAVEVCPECRASVRVAFRKQAIPATEERH